MLLVFLSGVRVTRSLSGVRITRSLSGVRVTRFFEWGSYCSFF